MNKEERSSSPKESLEQSLKEMKKMRSGEIEKITWNHYKNQKGE
jgi:hypothetical protein